jgi:hypothetical protein
MNNKRKKKEKERTLRNKRLLEHCDTPVTPATWEADIQRSV